jgi:class 3 adenylate cyclase/pimeloyl-ACP methyl ester carboxylesterase
MKQRGTLDAKTWEVVQDLFLQALERPEEERSAFVEQACLGNERMQHEVTSLLRSHEHSGLMDLDETRPPEEDVERLARFASEISDRYSIQEEIGRGGMANVFLAEDLRHRRQVAIKVLRPEVASSLSDKHFLREIEISARLRHPHILPLFDSGQAGGVPFFVMPFVNGESLRDRLDREGKLGLQEALRIGRQVADALGHAHTQGVVHRDIKPGNILIEARHAVVADFGIGRAHDFAGGDARLTRTGISLGTPTYMSPEQMSSDGEVDARSDLYALGCVIFEMVAARPPFRGQTVVNLVKQHVLEEPPRLADLVPDAPGWLSDVLVRVLAKDPDQRFQTAEEMLEALHGHALSKPSAPQGRRRRLAAILSADVEGYGRLMGEDETGTIRTLTECRVVIADAIDRHGGRVVDTPGDNVLAEFPSVVQAVEAAVEMQECLEEKSRELPADRRMRFRIGINLGDVIVEGHRVYGEGVNVAARLEALAEAGGICISGDVHGQVEGKLPLTFEDLGPRSLKNISKPVRVYRVHTAAGVAGDPFLGNPTVRDEIPEQEIRFCTAPDGVRLAYAIAGDGPPLVKTANWLNHVEYDWRSPIWAPLLHELTRDSTLIRYDARANGLSDWDVPEVSFDAFVQDLETVADAAGLDRFSLLGVSQGCSVSIAYAVRHPERVSKLILFGGYARGAARRGKPGEVEEADAIATLMAQGWGRDNPAYRQIFTSRFIPGATPEQQEWFNDLQRMTASPENAVRIRRAINVIEVEHLLPEVSVPTLVIHMREDATVPFEEGKRIAARIRGARFVPLEGRNHLIMEGEPSWPRFLREIRDFLTE